MMMSAQTSEVDPGEGINQLTEKSFLRIFSYFGDDNDNKILQDIENPNSNFLRGLSANKTRPVVRKHCSTFEEFKKGFIKTPDTTIGLAFRGQAKAWHLNSSLFRQWVNLKKSLKINIRETCGTSIGLNGFIDSAQELAKQILNSNGQNLPPDNSYLMAVLQHYARTSPLLDWTLNVNRALYFAFADAPAERSKNVAIYIADIGKVNNLALHTINAGMNFNAYLVYSTTRNL